MEVLAVSDNEVPQMRSAEFLCDTYANVELLISCGDMRVDYLEFISSILCVPLFFVRGNHDTRYVPASPGGDNMHMKIKRYRGFTFAGLEGSINYNNGAVQYTENEMLLSVLWLMPRLLVRRAQHRYGVDVLITHSPPKGIHDIPDDYAHRGFRSFRYLMQWGRPRYLLHGHVDTWDNRKPRQTQYAGTTVLNINPYMLVTLEK